MKLAEWFRLLRQALGLDGGPSLLMAPWRYASLLDTSRELAANGASDEEILGTARSEGASLLESIRLYREVRDVPLDVAKEKVHLSKTWADQRKAYDRFHEVMERVAREAESRGTKERE